MPLTLLFGVHAHQPVGNPPAVVDHAHERSYRPFLQTLHRFPEFRFSAHFSGWLLDYLLERHPQDMALLREMVARGQVELFSSGWSEPVLAAIPHRDRMGQLAMAAERIERSFGIRPHGSWLTERVWESSVVPSLVQSGIRYVTVDDYHFRCAGKTVSELGGYYTTEEDGMMLDVFPISELLRYKLPFSPAAEALAAIECLADKGHNAAIYFDDIEKFGIWPETWEWVYEKRWLEQFIAAVLASSHIRTATYHDFHATMPTRGIAYLPTASYFEMNEYTLPLEPSRSYAALVQEHKDAKRYEDTKPFLRGGIWRNFLMRYPEANWMHKRMLALSQRLARLASEQRTAGMTEQLYRAQANDAYWHGLFGGIYLPHLRREVYHNLVLLERTLDSVAPRAATEQADLDCDGIQEFFLRNAELQAVVRDDGLAALHEFDSYRLAHNFGDTLRRSREHYYDKIERGESQAQVDSGISSAHDRLMFRHEIGAQDIAPDCVPRLLFCDRAFAPDGTQTLLDNFALDEINPAQAELAFRTRISGGSVRKRYCLDGARLAVHYDFEAVTAAMFSTELNISMPSCDGYSGRYIFAGGEIPCGFGQALTRDALGAITLDDRELNGALLLTASPLVSLHAQPYFTVSQSEAGFEKIMQAACITMRWPLTASHVHLSLTLEVQATATVPARRHIVTY